MATRDQWATWLLERRFACGRRGEVLEQLGLFRDRVLDNAHLTGGETLLDVGCGGGLIGFGALDRGAAMVIFSDVSRDLLEVCRAAAADPWSSAAKAALASPPPTYREPNTKPGSTA